MPQETNLNVAPYFDDFDTQSNYYKVLFKPAYPVQARELNNLQSILQDQVENVGNHFFKEGAKVIPGQTTYLSSFSAVQIEPQFTGLPVSTYLDQLINKTLTGRRSGVTAKVVKYLTDSESERGNYTLYVDYVESGTDSSSTKEFFDNEILSVSETISFSNTFISAGEGVAQTLASNSSALGSAFGISNGVYFLRGYFVDVFDQLMILDQYSNTPSYRIGLYVQEELVSSESDRSLNDNAQGFSNFTAPGADRLKISADLAKRDLDDFDDQNFVQIAEVRNGILRELDKGGVFNQQLKDELARRTFDESGHYYVREFVTTMKDSLNNGFGNRGLFNVDQLTSGGSKPSKDLAVYKISPGKAYVRGYEIDKNTHSYLDCPKPRTTNTAENQAVNFGFGPTWRVNRTTGSPYVGFNTSTTLGLRSRRVGVDSTTAAGTEIGIARVYDFALESGAYDLPNPNLNRWDLSLFDVQTYTDISINEAHTIPVPSFVEGQSSGATGYLRTEVVVGTGITVYGGKGNFVIGERITFNGIGTDARTAIGVTQYSLSDVESVYGNTTSGSGTGINTFTADLVTSTARVIGIASISAAPTISWIKTNGNISGGVTVTSPGFTWPGIVTTGDLVSFSVGGQTDKHFARVESVATNSIGISSVANVIGICTGDLPHGNGGTLNVTATEVTNFTLLESRLQEQLSSGNAANNESLYSIFPRKNIESINFVDNTLDIRKQFNDLQIDVNGDSSTITAGTDEVFLSFDEERYTMVRSDGSIISLTQGNLDFGSGNTTLTFKGLESGFNNIAKVTATLRQSKITSKQKVRNIGATTLIEYSTNSASGTDVSGGAATLNDGLTFGNYPYGTRVQDAAISLNVPDVTVLYGLFESQDTDDPVPPSMTVGSMDGPTSTSSDLIIGEEVVGSISGSRGKYISKLSNTSIQFIYMNQTVFANNEVVKFLDSGISAVVSSVSIGSKNITQNFTLSSGQKSSIYDYARLLRKADAPIPSQKLKAWYLSGSYNSSDTGDITTVNSYSDFEYGSEIPSVNGVRCSDIVDCRPRVSDFSVSAGSRSPFEFLGRSFDGGQHSSKNVIASDESIILDYDYYLPRIDRIYLDKEGLFTVRYGVPADNPTPPEGIAGAINIANVFLPGYLFSIEQAKIKFIEYRRYQMNDINRLEQRLRNVEYYTSLSRLEQNVASQFVPDANGLNRFKNGFFTDKFNDLSGQDLGVGIRNSIDRYRGELRPSHYTTSFLMQLGSDAVAGIGTTAISSDPRFANILGANIRKNIKNDGDPCSVICLDYDDAEWLTQPFATRSESVTPFLVRFWQGTLSLNPTADVWIDPNQLDTRQVTMMGSLDGLAGAMRVELEGEPGSRSGVSPVIWGAWETTGVDVDFSLDMNNSTESNPSWRQGTASDLGVLAADDWRAEAWGADTNFPETFKVQEETSSTTITVNGTVGVDLDQQRKGVQNTVVEKIDTESLGSRMVSREIIYFMRSRNIEFSGRSLKPYTRIYAFLDGIDVTDHCFSKLVEISMVTGTFEVGETIIGAMSSVALSAQDFNDSTLPKINCIAAQANHKYGPFDDPSDVFVNNPYDRTNILPATYSESSTILNIDTNTLAAEENASQGGYLAAGMTLIGQTSGAQATITGLGMMTDQIGTLIGSLRIPDATNTQNPTFETGRNRLRLSSSETNSTITGLFSTAAEETFYSQGDIDHSEEVTLSLRNAEVSVDTSETNPDLLQTRTIGDSDSASASTTLPSVTETTGEYLDPLAQSFTVDDSEGVFISSVDVFFQSVDISGPVYIQMREVELGMPVTKYIAGSQVTVDPNNISTSQDATIPTNIKFDYPVYLNGKKEYALAILSNATEYRVWISRLGEVDVTTLDQGESGQTLVSTQTLLGSLFKSQTGSTWTPSQYEDLKFKLYRANFVSNGNVQFFNPPLDVEMERIKSDGLIPYSNDIRVGVNTVLQDTSLIAGSKVTQQNTTASGIFVGYGGSATGTLGLTNTGIGYTPLAGNCFYPGVSLKTLTGSGIDATANITVKNGIAVAATVTSVGGKGYVVGDMLTVTSIGATTTGSGMRLSVSSIAGPNELRLVGVQGEFTTGSSDYLKHQNSVGVTTTMNYSVGKSGAVIPQSPIRTLTDGLHMKIFHRNHGMHTDGNVVTLKGVGSDVSPSTLSAAILNTTTSAIGIGATTNFAAFENVAVGSTNAGYVKIGEEIIKYTGVSGATLTGITRAQEGTIAANHAADDQVYKYEMDGISLRRINTNHNLNEVTVDDPITLDTYYVKIDMASNGENRTGAAGSLPSLHFNSTKSSGGVNAKATYNIPFEEVIPSFNVIAPTATNVTAAIRTVSGTSIDGIESSFVDKGFQDITINQPNYFDSPRIVASRINEETYLGSLPGYKSLTVNMSLSTGNPKLSPMIDLDQASCKFITNRVNSPIDNFATNYKVKGVPDDPCRFFYVSKNIALENPSTSLKVILDAYVNNSNDLRVFYALDQNTLVDEVIFTPFPGFSNLNQDREGVIINKSNSDGKSDKSFARTDSFQPVPSQGMFREMQFTIDRLPSYNSFRIKIIGTSTNQAYVPKVRNLRALALA